METFVKPPSRRQYDRSFSLLKALFNRRADRIEKFLAAPTRLRPVLRFLREHQLGGFAHVALEETGLLGRIPEPMRNELARAYLAQWRSSEKVQRAIRTLDPLLSENRRVYLKGPLFGERFYGRTDARSTGDVDLLVPEPEFRQVEKKLQKEGWQLHVSDRALFRLLHYHFEYRKNGLGLDLHWALRQHLGCFRLDYERLFSTRLNYRWENREYPVLDWENELTFHVLILFSDLIYGIPHLRAYLDVYALLKGGAPKTDWSAFFRRRRSEGTEAIVRSLLAFVLHRFHCEKEFSELSQILTDKDRAPADFLAKALYELLVHPDAGNRFHLPAMQLKGWAWGQYRGHWLRRGVWFTAVTFWDWGGWGVKIKRAILPNRFADSPAR